MPNQWVLAKSLSRLALLWAFYWEVGGTIFFQNCNPPDEDKGCRRNGGLRSFCGADRARGDIQDYCIVDKYPDVETFSTFSTFPGRLIAYGIAMRAR